jgi:hypothetical protein
MVKEKLTLSVDKEVVEKAKKLGINISDITEKLLRGYTSAEKPTGNLHEAYQKLFDSIRPLVKEFDCSVKIAEGYDTVISTDSKGVDHEEELPVTIYLLADGTFYADEFDYGFKDIKMISPSQFLSAEKILYNLVNVLVKTEENRKERMNEILMAKRIIDAMSETLLKRQSKTEK